MRFAFHLVHSANQLTVELFDAANLSIEKGGATPLATIGYEKTKGKWVYDGAFFPLYFSRADSAVISKLAKANVEAIAEGETIKATSISPLLFLRALLSRRAVQVAKDTQAGKFRCVSTMKEGFNSYAIQGLGAYGISVDAEDEETAVKIAKREVANEMAANHEKADKLVGFFSGGCKVKQILSGSLPDFVKVESLAESPAEEKLAKTPVKRAVKEDDEAETK